MYIDPFLAGVLSTVLVVCVGLVALALFMPDKTDKKGDND